MTILSMRLFAARLLPFPALLLGSLLCAYVAVSSDGRLLKAFVAMLALGLAVSVPPDLFVAASVFLFAVSTVRDSPLLSVGSAQFYITDLIVLLIVIRAVLPRERLPPIRALAGLPSVLAVLWALVMTLAAVRGMHNGVSLPSAVRASLALIYWPLLYIGFTRILRERRLNEALLWRNLALAVVGLAGWMFLARALNHPFHDPGIARVATGEREVVYRNFGVAGAFTLYPLLALVGMAGMSFAGRRRWVWFALATVGTIATLMTFVRGAIFGLILGAVVLIWLRPRHGRGSSRAITATQVILAAVAVVIGLTAANPKLGNAIVQRTLPFTTQAENATENAEYRWKAVSTGLTVATEEPGGLGVLDTGDLSARGIDYGYLAHSGVATLLIFGGWPALVLGTLVLLALARRSFAVPASSAWLHPAFVAVLTTLAIYSIGAAGLVGDAWVIPLGALAVSLRFTLARDESSGQHDNPDGVQRTPVTSRA